jgi:hypothetical protein
MEHTPALLYTLGLLPFGLDLTRLPPCIECCKRAVVGVSHSHICIMHPPTGQMLHRLIYSQVNEVAGK